MMHRSTFKRADSLTQYTEPRSPYPKGPHHAIIVGKSGCGKTEFVFDLLEGPYRGVFQFIVIMCPTWLFNEAYKKRSWIWTDRRILLCDPGDELHDCLRRCYYRFKGHHTLYILDDLAAKKAMTQKKDMLSELAFSGRHAKQSVWILTQKYNAVCTDFREQVSWVGLFHCKDRDSFSECLQENDAIPTSEERDVVRHLLRVNKHSKVILFNDQPPAYKVLMAGEIS